MRLTLLLVAATAPMFMHAATAFAGWAATGGHSSLGEVFFASRQVVTGVFENVKRLPFDDPNVATKMVRFECKFRIHETLFGTSTGPVLALDMNERADMVGRYWMPAAGSKALVFVRNPNVGYFSFTNVVYGFRIGDYNDPRVSTHRTIGRILGLPTVAEQAHAVAGSCFSSDRTVQVWSMRTLAGRYESVLDAAGIERVYRKDPNWIHSYVGNLVAWDVVERVCYDDEHDFEFLKLCDGLAAEDPRYRRSQRRYEILWSMVYACLRESPALQHTRLMWFFSRDLPREFPDRRDESFARIRELVLNKTLPSNIRGISVRYIDNYASDATREQAAGLLESQMLGGDGLVADYAAIATMDVVADDVKSGREPSKRLLDLVQHPERCPMACRGWLRQAEAKVKELSARQKSPRPEP